VPKRSGNASSNASSGSSTPQAQDTGGADLSLAIVAEVASTHDGTVHFEGNGDNEGTVASWDGSSGCHA
jgi:hypothetical protein